LGNMGGKKAGGAIKLAKGGGITDTDAIESFAEDLSIPQLQQSMQSGQLKGKEYIGMPILQNKVAEAERMKMAQTMMGSEQQGQPQSISDAIDATCVYS
jgi:replication fork clamp-binding protein CrfC